MDPQFLETLPVAPEVLGGVAAAIVLLLVGGLSLRRRAPGAVGVEPEADSLAEAVTMPAQEVRSAQLPTSTEGFFAGLARTRAAFSGTLARLLGGDTLDEDALEELEETLITADVGVRTAAAITDTLRDAVRTAGGPADLRALLRAELRTRVGPGAPIAPLREGEPLAILVVGVNGSGKTTTIGKLAARYKRAGHSVMLAAGDTFRAGAIEQLKVWGERSGVPVVAHQEGGDPAAVLFDALQSARAKGVDVVICDTAGRLQAQKTLMDELGKVVRVMGKAQPGAPHEVLIVLDGTIGQNAMSQARIFKDVVGVTGVVLTKLDGTARGGVVVAVRDELGLPVKLVGLGEGIDDLRDFDGDAFVDALLGDEHSTTGT